MKSHSWLSYTSLLISVVPIPLFFAMLYALIQAPESFVIILLLLCTVACGMAVVALVKKTEKNILGALSLLISIASGGFILFVMLMSNMSPPSS